MIIGWKANLGYNVFIGQYRLTAWEVIVRQTEYNFRIIKIFGIFIEKQIANDY